MTRNKLLQTTFFLGMTLMVLTTTAISVRAQMHDQQTGSAMIYNYYTSDSGAPWSQNTTFTITNTNTTTQTRVRMFYVNGDTGAVKTNSICLGAGATWTGLMSTENPNVTGYIVVVAVDSKGSPANFNWLMGTAAITLNSGHHATLPAIAWDTSRPTLAPTQLMVDMVPSPQDSQFPLLVVNRINGSLVNQMTALGTVSGVVSHTHLPSDRVSGEFTFTASSNGPQLRANLDDTFPLEGTLLSELIHSGETASMTINADASPGGSNARITGAILYFSPSTEVSVGGFTGGNNLRHTEFSTVYTSMAIPILKPFNCLIPR